MKSLFSKREARCETCARCAFSADSDRLLCGKKGLVARDGHCHAYRYDPLKRIPAKAPDLPKLQKEDFSLE